MDGHHRSLRLAVLVWLGTVFVTSVASTNSPAPTASAPATNEDTAWSQHVVETYQTLAEQQRATLRAVESVRDETAAAAKRNTEALDARLQQLEQAITSQRLREVDTLQGAHRFTLEVVGAFAGVGFIGMLVVVLVVLRTLHRRAATTAPQPVGPAFGVGYGMAALSTGAGPVATLDPAQQASTQFLSAVERLEKRIAELDAAAHAPPPMPAPVPAAAAPEPFAPPSEPSLAPHAARAALLLGKGQALLNLQQADSALTCFDEAARLDPTGAEAFVKKGAALEKLGRLDEAIDCYDRAIALNNALTMAYLCKGGVFNRLERYSEALQCYEQALRAQEHSQR